MAVTVGSLIRRARRRCDMVNSTFLDDTEDMIPWVNASVHALYELLATTWGENYFLATAAATVTATDYLPVSGVWKVLRVDTAFDGVRKPMRRFNPVDTVFDETAVNWTAGTDVRYCFEGGVSSKINTSDAAIRFHPRPSGNHVVHVWYVRGHGELTTVSDIIQEAMIHWDEYIVVDCAIKAKIKADEDASSLLLEKAELKQRITDAAPNRDIGQPTTTVDVQSIDGSTGSDWWW